MNYCALLHKACCYILIRNWDAQRKYSFYFQSIYITNTFLGLNIFIYQNQFDIGPHRLIRAFCCQRISSFCFNKYASWIEFINFILSALRYKERCSCIDQIKYNQFTFGCMYINGFFLSVRVNIFIYFAIYLKWGKKQRCDSFFSRSIFGKKKINDLVIDYARPITLYLWMCALDFFNIGLFFSWPIYDRKCVFFFWVCVYEEKYWHINFISFWRNSTSEHLL